MAMTVVLPAPVAQFQGDTGQLRIGFLIYICQPVQDHPISHTQPGSNLGKPYQGFYGFDLAEEGTVVAEFVLPPMQEQAGRLRRYSPVVGSRYVPPLVDAAANLINCRRNVVLLLLGGQAQSLVNDKLLLSAPRPSSLPRLGNWRDELGSSPAFYDLLGRLAVFVQLPMLGGIFVWRVDYRSVKERVFHNSASLERLQDRHCLRECVASLPT